MVSPARPDPDHGSPAPGSVTSEGDAPRRRSEEEAKEGSMVQPPAKRMKEGTEESMGTHHEKTSAAAGGDGGSSAASTAAPARTPSTRLRVPPYPTTGKWSDLLKWSEERRRIMKISAADPKNNLPTLRQPKDPETACAVKSLADKAAVQHAARSIVSVCIVSLDGCVRPQYTGIIIDEWKHDTDSPSSFVIVTCSNIVSNMGKLLDPVPKLAVTLPNKKTIMDVRLAHVVHYYDIAILLVSLDFALTLPSIGPGPEYGQEVFVLAREKESSLIARKGKIKWLEESDILERNYYMFLSCELPAGGGGGQVIDSNGNTRGMAFSWSPYPAVISISTVVTCVNMFKQFNHIAHPKLGLGLRTIAFMDVQTGDELYYKYGIENGFIVDRVPYDSDAEKLGIERGDVILSWGDQGFLTLPELEDYLLSLGWECLKNKSVSVRLMVIVRDLTEHSARSILLPITYS